MITNQRIVTSSRIPRIRLAAVATAIMAILAVLPLAALNAQAADETVVVTGTVSYRQRIAMPSDAVLAVRVEDVSLADAPAKILAESSTAFGKRQVPLSFSLEVPRAAIDSRLSYVVRATISVDGQLRFTTTRNFSVLTRGAPNHVDLVLDPVLASSTGAAPPASTGAMAPTTYFTLPATFFGILPCADCEGIEQTLTLRADGLYRMRRTYLGKSHSPFGEAGRWTVEPDRLVLRSASDVTILEVRDASTLRLLDQQGQPIISAANLELRRSAQVDPINESALWRGEFRYVADSASFLDCTSALRWPVAMTADYLTLERIYQRFRRAPGEPLLVTFDGGIAVLASMEGAPREHMVVDWFRTTWPGATCASVVSADESLMAQLKDTYWKLIELGGKKITVAPAQQREARITLASKGATLMGFSGCNRVAGSYVQDGGALRFAHMASTRIACAPPVMELEDQILKMLGATTAYRIDGERLILFGDRGVLARFEAVYLR